MKTTRTLLSAAIVAGVALTCLVLGPGPQAAAKGKPGGTPPPTGEVYFQAYDQDAQQWNLAVMNPDGTGKTFLPAVPANAQPSYAVHDGDRWYLAFTETPGEFHPDGQPRGILEAVREDGAARVTIVDDPGMYYNETFRWSKDDGWISFSGYEWDNTVSPPEPVAAALYVVPVQFIDGVGPVPLAAPAPVADGGVWFSNPRFYPTIGNHDWSPAGDRIVFSDYDRQTGSHLFIVDLVAANVSPLALVGSWPSWSPDGRLIAFRSFLSRTDKSTIETIEADDTDESTRTILFDVKWSKGFTNTWVNAPHWSPTGSHLAFLFLQNGGGEYINHIYRMDSQGRDIVDLTPDIPQAVIRGWR